MIYCNTTLRIVQTQPPKISLRQSLGFTLRLLQYCGFIAVLYSRIISQCFAKTARFSCHIYWCTLVKSTTTWKDKRVKSF